MWRTPWPLKTTKIANLFFRYGFSRERVGTYPTGVTSREKCDRLTSDRVLATFACALVDTLIFSPRGYHHSKDRKILHRCYNFFFSSNKNIFVELEKIFPTHFCDLGFW